MTSIGSIRRAVLNAPDSLARRTSGVYRREIDGLRFFAILFVMIGHLCERSFRFSSGNLASSDIFANAFYFMFKRPGTGVNLFFMISGFVIFTPVAGRGPRAINISFLKSYFSRRILRIEPPYFLLLVATYVLVAWMGFVPPDVHRFNLPPTSLSTSLLASLFYSHGWIFGTMPRLLAPGWSLEIEIQFYAIAPLLFFIYMSIRRPSIRACVGMMVLALSTIGASLIESRPEFPHLNFSLLQWLPFFWIGILFCDFQTSITSFIYAAPGWLARAVGWAGVMVLLTMSFSDSSMGSRLMMISSPLVGCTLIFAGALRRDSLFYRLCSSRWMSLIGGACYSIYLTHLQIMQILCRILANILPEAIDKNPFKFFCISFLTVFPMTILFGMIFYVFIERTFMVRNWPSKLAMFIHRRVGERISWPKRRGVDPDNAMLGEPTTSGSAAAQVEKR